MKIKSFHNPNISFPVIRRQAAGLFLDILFVYLEMGPHPFRWINRCCFSRKGTYSAAVYRLKKAGVIARRGTEYNSPRLALTDEGRKRVSDVLKPENLWKRGWNGIWYILTYDIPEGNRRYRDALRGFLHRMRMGCLQKSVWVTPIDIRPEFHDLTLAADIDRYAFLFESTNVLRRSNRDIVYSAWDFEELNMVQSWYRKVYSENLLRLESGHFSEEQMITLMREEMSAYLVAMEEDPILPVELWPSGYHGEEVFRIHTQLVKEIRRRLKNGSKHA